MTNFPVGDGKAEVSIIPVIFGLVEGSADPWVQIAQPGGEGVVEIIVVEHAGGHIQVMVDAFEMAGAISTFPKPLTFDVERLLYGAILMAEKEVGLDFGMDWN